MMLKIIGKVFGLVLFSLMLPSGLDAQPANYVPVEDTAAFMENLRTSIRQTQTIQSRFRQLKHLDVFEEEIKSDGVFYYERPDKVRWEYTDPISYIIVMTGDQILIKSDDRVNEYSTSSNRFFEQINAVLIGSIQGNILGNRELFDVKYYRGADSYLALLYPLQEGMGRMLEHVKMYFDTQDLTVTGLVFVEPGGDYTKISFYDKKINAEIPEDIFSLD